jgi:hypothetical protein
MYVQNLTLSVTRAVRNNLTVDVQYIGTLSRKQFTSINLNSANFLYNGLLDEFNKVRAGGESAVLNQMMNGVNICATGCATGVQYGPIGSTVGGVLQTAAYQMRKSSTFNQNLANGNYSVLGVANSLATLNYVKVGCPSSTTGNCNLPDVPTPQRGAVLSLNGVPENFILTNPQFARVNYMANMGNNNYHSFSFRITESKSLQFRADAFNVFNHSQPGAPNLSINPSSLTTGAALPWGQITTKTGNRTFQGQLRLMF